jgi:hypothetical protein
MKYMKNLGLLAITAVALMAFASSAAATVTSSGGSTPTIFTTTTKTEIHPGSGSSFLTVSCEHSHMHKVVTRHIFGLAVAFKILTSGFKVCTDPVTVLNSGEMEVHSTGTTGNGTVTSSGMEIRIHTSEGPVCTFKTSNTDIGTLVGGKPAKLNINSASIPASGFLCPSTGVWTGLYTFSSPSELSIH